MTIKNKKLKMLALRLAELSRGAAGTVEESRVRAVLAELAGALPPRVLRPILKFYYSAIARELRFSEVRIEYAGTLPAGTENDLAAHFSEAYARSFATETEQNPALLGGLRVQVGDDVYDASLAGTLAALRRKLSST